MKIIKNKVASTWGDAMIDNVDLITMLDEFHGQLVFLLEKYDKKEITFQEFKHQINRLQLIWNYSRIDIKNQGIESNSINVKSNKNLKVSYPKWFKNKTGTGCKIESQKHNFNITFSCINEGDLTIFLKGVDFRDINNQRKPVYVIYRKFIMNKEIIFDEDLMFYHDNSFTHSKHVENNNKFTLEIECSTIYDEFPQLKLLITNLINQENMYSENSLKIKDYIQKEMYYLEKMKR